MPITLPAMVDAIPRWCVVPVFDGPLVGWSPLETGVLVVIVASFSGFERSSAGAPAGADGRVGAGAAAAAPAAAPAAPARAARRCAISRRCTAAARENAPTVTTTNARMANSLSTPPIRHAHITPNASPATTRSSSAACSSASGA